MIGNASDAWNVKCATSIQEKLAITAENVSTLMTSLLLRLIKFIPTPMIIGENKLDKERITSMGDSF